jgi:hypothetical protein
VLLEAPYRSYDDAETIVSVLQEGRDRRCAAQQQAIVPLKQLVVPQVPTIVEAAISTSTKVLRRAFRSKDCVQVLHSARG